MEHHSNIVPWQLLCERTGATLRWFGITDHGRLDESTLDDLINPRTKLVSMVLVSNILGTANATSRIHDRVREVGALFMLDASQAVPHRPVDVVGYDADFVAFTGHKMLGPTGIGVLWGRGELLEAMPPFLGGGSMIETVTMERSTFAPPPARFEAGTPPIAEAVGLGAAVDYLSAIGMESIQFHEKELTAYALQELRAVPGLRIIGPQVPVGRGGTISFDLAGVHPHDVGQVLDAEGVQVRVGHHCARPTCIRFGVPATTRVSLYLYNTTEEIDALVRALDQRARGVRLMQLEQLYQDIILDHYKKPRGRGLREPYEAQVRHVNPTCGDEVDLRVHLVDGTVADVSYEGMGCSISQASASVLHELMVGRTVDDALSTVDRFTEMISSRGQVDAGRGRARGRRRVRRGREVPGPGQVRAAVVDGVQGRDRPGTRRRRRGSMSEDTLPAG